MSVRPKSDRERKMKRELNDHARDLRLLICSAAARRAQSPSFRVESVRPSHCRQLILGQVGGMAVDARTIWVLQRPRSLTDDEKGAR